MTVSVASLSAADIAAIESVHKQFPDVLLRRDFEALVAFYTEDAALMPPHHPAVYGRAAIKTWMAGFPQVTDFRLAVDRVDGRADLAYVRGTYTMSFRPEGAPAPINDRGKFIDILRRQPTGEWLLEADTFNSDNP
jgi:ketosteroid isomerase-like protein